MFCCFTFDAPRWGMMTDERMTNIWLPQYHALSAPVKHFVSALVILRTRKQSRCYPSKTYFRAIAQRKISFPVWAVASEPASIFGGKLVICCQRGHQYFAAVCISQNAGQAFVILRYGTGLPYLPMEQIHWTISRNRGVVNVVIACCHHYAFMLASE